MWQWTAEFRCPCGGFKDAGHGSDVPLPGRGLGEEQGLAQRRAYIASLPNRRYSYVMRPLRYSINVTLDGCCDHREGVVDEDLHRHAVENLEQADALLFGRVTYEMMEAAWRPPARTGARPDWMEPFARTIDAAKKLSKRVDVKLVSRLEFASGAVAMRYEPKR